MDDFLNEIGDSIGRQSEIDDMTDPEYQNNIISQMDINLKQAAEEAKFPSSPDVSVSLVDGKISISINDEPITVSANGKSYEFSEAALDPTVDPELTSQSLIDSMNKVGIDLNSYKTSITDNIENNPTRQSNSDLNTLELNKNKAIPNKSDIEYIDQKGSSLSNDDLESKCKDLNDKIKDLNEKMKDMSDTDKKSLTDKIKEKMITLGKLLAIIGVGYLTYDFLKQHALDMSGCIEYTQDLNNKTNKCKSVPLTCNSDASSTDTYNTDCDVPKPVCNYIDSKCNNAYACKLQSTDPDGNCIQCTVTMNGGMCSQFCNNAYLKTTDSGTKISYTCINASITDAISDIFNGVTNLANQLAKDGTSVLSNIWKYAKYIVLIILAIVAVWFIMKFRK